jgi:hypothetical protein
MDDHPDGSTGHAPLPKRKPGAALPRRRPRTAGVTHVRIRADGPQRWPTPDEPLLRRVYTGLEAMP